MSQVETLWARMAAIYGHRWVSAYSDNPAGMVGDTWAAGLVGLRGPHLARGLEACIASSDPWPPSLPEFRALCLGVPPFAAVRADAARTNPFTVLVWQNLDGHRYRHAPADQADRLLREAYELAREHVMRGGDLPEPPAALIEKSEQKPPTVPTTREERLARTQAAYRELYGSAP